MRLAVIGTFHGRHENTAPLLKRVLEESTRVPDEFWVMCEDAEDMKAADVAMLDIVPNVSDRMLMVAVEEVPTPRAGSGYAVIPYSYKINEALDESEADLFCYLDNNSMPHPDKYRAMAALLEEHPEYGACYCTQHRTGFDDAIYVATEAIPDAWCRLNYTQVMHRKTDSRWTLDMKYANPDLADAMFWRELHAEIGSFWPVHHSEVLDVHHIPSPAAVGI